MKKKTRFSRDKNKEFKIVKSHPQNIFDRCVGERRFSTSQFLKNSFENVASLYRKELKGHYGCVNAVEFSHDGRRLVSGGDDRRVLLWRVDEALGRLGSVSPTCMGGEHNSNIFCLAFDREDRTIFSGGNDEQIIVHDLETGATKDVYLYEDAIYCISPDPTNPLLFATACDDGRCQLYDLREPRPALALALAASPFHSVMFNPASPRLFVTANGKVGAQLWDVRRPNSQLLRYEIAPRRFDRRQRREQLSCMNARFSGDGERVVVLRRRMAPSLYKTESPTAWCQFDQAGYFNSCTLKSCSFAGADDEFVMSGSDDFNVYLWKVPTERAAQEKTWVRHAHHVLRGHRSIVNQVRFDPERFVVCSSGVEKVVSLWSPFNPSADDDDEDDDARLEEVSRQKMLVKDGRWSKQSLTLTKIEEMETRRRFTHEDYMDLVRSTGQYINHDYSARSEEEDPRMIAFFDSLVQREMEGWSSGSSACEGVAPIGEYVAGERESRATMEEEVEAESLSRFVLSSPETSDDDDARRSATPTPNSPDGFRAAETTSGGEGGGDDAAARDEIAARRKRCVKLMNMIKRAKEDRAREERGRMLLTEEGRQYEGRFQEDDADDEEEPATIRRKRRIKEKRGKFAAARAALRKRFRGEVEAASSSSSSSSSSDDDDNSDDESSSSSSSPSSSSSDSSLKNSPMKKSPSSLFPSSSSVNLANQTGIEVPFSQDSSDMDDAEQDAALIDDKNAVNMEAVDAVPVNMDAFKKEAVNKDTDSSEKDCAKKTELGKSPVIEDAAHNDAALTEADPAPSSSFRSSRRKIDRKKYRNKRRDEDEEDEDDVQ